MASKTVTISLDETVLAAIDEYAYDEGRSRSNMIDRLLQSALASNSSSVHAPNKTPSLKRK